MEMGVMRLDKYLSEMGIDTRSELKKQIRWGNVTLNDKKVKDPGYHVKEDDVIYYKGKKVVYEKYQYFMLNKPDGILTAARDKKQPTVMDLFSDTGRKDLAPVGRLDKDTHGLLFITNDGELAHYLLSPKNNVPKVYYAEVEGVLTNEDVIAFEEGLQIDEEFKALPAKLEIMESDSISKAYITVCEGKFHQVKRMFQAVSKEVVYLKRVKMAGISLDESLDEGTFRVLTKEELDILNTYRKGINSERDNSRKE